MAVPFCFLQYFLLFLCFSGVNQFVNPSSDSGLSIGSGMEPEPEYPEPLAMEDHRFYMHRKAAVPPSHADPIQEPLRRHYKLEDFLWTGSGDGPNPSELDGGLAWEDNGTPNSPDFSGQQSRSWIRVTKTMTLYRTVLTTIYPIEMTPTVISGLPIQPTPYLSSPSFPDPGTVVVSVSPSYSDELLSMPSGMWAMTPSFITTPEPTKVFQSSPSPSSTASTGVQDNFSAESTDLVYWIQTSIKANDSVIRDAPQVFQTNMQKSLARVYAVVFKRHLLSTLGVRPSGKGSNRKKRRSSKEDSPDGNFQWLYSAQSAMSPSQLKRLETTAMNVTVNILNITSNEPHATQLDVKYIVLAEGTPVPAFSAVKELDLMSKEEMEHEIGYKIINKKAEALVAGPPEQMTRNEKMVATSPWLIVAMTTICLLVVLLVLIAFMVWKWKHNRLGDSRRLPASISTRPQSGIEIEEGVINPAFHGTPSRTGRGGIHEQSPRSSPASSLLARARKIKKISDVLSKHGSRLESGKTDEKKRSHKFDHENSPTSSEDLRVHKRPITSSEGSAEWKELLAEPKPKGIGKGSLASSARARQRSPMRGKVSSGTKQDRRDKDIIRRRRRKSQISKEEATLKTDESEMSQSSLEGENLEESSAQDAGPNPSRGMTDAISLGNLDICQDAIAQTPSDYAKRIVPWKRPGSAVAGQSSKGGGPDGGSRRPGSRVAMPETIEEIPSFDLTEDDDGIKEQDRELSEKSFDMKDSPRRSDATPDTKDAQVQTPTRISKTASHKARAAPKPRRSWRGSPGGPSESVISTESEEIVEVHHINSSMSDDQNPLGRMRKRFHQFLDDAFNVMGNNKQTDPDNKAETQSAKVSICHEVVETETEWRPWTSHVIREETLQKLKRPKSAAVPIGPPKRAWTASSERKTHSAKSKPNLEAKSAGSTSRVASTVDIQESHRPTRQSSQSMIEDEDESYEKTSTSCNTARDDVRTHLNKGGGNSSGSANTSDQSQSHSVILSPAFIFPQYPTYPDIRIETGPATASSTGGSNQSQPPLPPPSLPSNDPAVPLIQAIKNEMKRFEKEPPNPK